MKYIRWGGLIPFVAICAALGIFWNFYVDHLVEYVIEDQGSKIVGAKVEVDSVDVTLLPLGIKLMRLQVTNPRNYMENAIEVGIMGFDMELFELLRRNVMINNLTMLGIQFGTPRKTPGDIPRSEKYGVQIKELAKETIEELELPSFEIPDVKKIFEEEDLETLRLVNEVKQQVLDEKAAWEKRIKELPSQERFKEYETRLKKLQSASGPQAVLAAAADITKIKKEIEQDIERIKSAKDDALGLVGKLEARAKQAQQAPFNDIKRLRDKYGLSPEGLANLSNRLLGPKVAALVREGNYYYQMAAPYILKSSASEGPKVVKPLRAKGRDVRFKDHRPIPRFLVVTSNMEFVFDFGKFAGRVSNIASDQKIWGQPLMVGILGQRMPRMNGILIDAVFDYTKPDTSTNKILFGIDGYGVENFALSTNKQWPITLTQGITDLSIEGKMTDGILDFTIGGILRSGEIQTAFTNKNLIAEALADAIEGIKTFKLTAKVHGTMEDFDISIESDIDQILKQAVGSLVTKQMEKFEAQLRQMILAKVDGPLKDLLGNVGGFDDIMGLLQDREKLAQSVMQMALKQATGGTSIPGTNKLPLKLPF